MNTPGKSCVDPGVLQAAVYSTQCTEALDDQAYGQQTPPQSFTGRA
ncbi:MAG: hypothetical protein J0H50_09555 [Xanthomonadales bacterium]|nr:hypothetical protein [Xanthomonadales bacterium]